MATTLQPLDILRVVILCADTEQISMNTFHYQVTAVGTPGATDEDVAINFDAAIAAGLKNFLANSADYRGTLVQRIWPLPIPANVFTINGAGPGVAGATTLPRQTAGLTSWHTTLAGRAYRGRTYWPFPATAHDTGDGVPNAAYVATASATANVIINFSAISNGGRSATVSLGLYHRKLHTITPVSSYIQRLVWATCRRRGSYGAPNRIPF